MEHEMSSQAEDIIRETFSSLAKAIGVQIDIPDEMIANLAARLQAQIDLLAELQSTGRLLADDEMRLTAEEVEDVKIVLGQLERGGPAFEAAHERLRALFPATEPAEEPCTGNLWCEAPLHAEGCYATHRIPPGRLAPAEPAEQETKAVTFDEIAQSLKSIGDAESSFGFKLDYWGKIAEKLIAKYPHVLSSPVVEEETKAERCPSEIEGWGCSLTNGHDGDHTAHDQDGPAYVWPASSPVVPAPTETGPWHDITKAPRHLTLRDRDGDTWTYVGDNWVTPETAILTVERINKKYAPFVAAKEG